MDDSEDDGDPDPTPEQGRQPTRDGDTLTVYFPVPHTFRCRERGCRAAYGAAQWTSRRQSLQRHLEQQHNCRIRRTINLCSICGATLGLRASTHACLAATSVSAAPVSQPHQCRQCPMSFPTRMGMSNHEQWHRMQAALAARSNPTAGAPTTSNDGAPTQDDSGNPLPEQDSTRASPGPSGEVADQEPVDEALRQDSSGEADEDPPWQAPTLADTASSPLPETPATPTDQTSPENQLAGMEGPAASGEPSPEPAGSQESGDSQAYATQEEAAGTMGPEDSAWMLREETAELRELRRLPESAGDWAR
ncbi:hypothetical protein HPB49_000337 [Dermacentor silvarum]|uniref:Uncharacterized protein n=1 Tax=Dermacentor silvarum TaxID=543639 RepID=A0ACB8CCI8_DERSI|nr:hypothetical protein HPB49_000337 [Dermacentor silvarum]